MHVDYWRCVYSWQLIGKFQKTKCARVRDNIAYAIRHLVDPGNHGHENYFPSITALSYGQLATSVSTFGTAKEIPRCYELGNSPAAITGIWLNGAGWSETTGQIGPTVALFFDSPGKLIVEVAAAPNESLRDHDYRAIKAKVGLEFLQLESVAASKNDRILTFLAPTTEEYRHGIQVVFLSFVMDNDFLQPSPFRLVRVECERRSN